MNMSMVDVINGRQHTGMSDDQMSLERKLQREAQSAANSLMTAFCNINRYSMLQKTDITALACFLGDEMPDEDQLEEKISEARRA